jgi:hypothetical protein
MLKHVAIAALTLLALAPQVPAADPPPPSAQELASALRGLLLTNLPEPLVQQQQNWGKQVEAAGKRKVNHGIWRRAKVTALNPANTLTVNVGNIQQPEANRTLFDLSVDFNAQVDFEQQLWERGLHLYSGSTRARAKVHVALQCEVITRVETNKGLLPDIVFRLKVTKANLTYSGLDFVHIGGIGGDGADVIGKALFGFLKALRPTLERDLLNRANTAIVKAGDAKEVRISLGKLLMAK